MKTVTIRIGKAEAKTFARFAESLTTPAAVNKVLKARGHAERLRRGRGYYYFTDGNAHAWYSSSVPVCWLVGSPEKFADMRDDLANDWRNADAG